MGFKEIQDLDADITFSIGGVNRKTGKKNPTKVEGYFLGKRIVDNARAKGGKSTLYFFQTSQGNVGVWGKTDLDRKMSAATPGTMTRVSANGTVATPNGDMYKFKVEQDPDNTIDVSNLAGGSTNEGSSDSDESYAGETETEYTDGSDEDAGQEDALAALAAQRRAKVEALLKSKGSKA